MVIGPKRWSREARIAVLAWTCSAWGYFLLNLAIDYFIEEPEQVTLTYLTVRPLATGVFWFAGILVIRSAFRKSKSGGS